MPNDVLTIAIAGMPVAFRIRNARLRARVRTRYGGYLTRRAAELTMECICTTQVRGGELVRVAMVDGGGMEATRRDFATRGHGVKGEVRLLPSIYAFDACLRVLLSARLPQAGALLVHGSAVVTARGDAVLFLGPSGSGKTTVARLCRCRHVLNDEICALAVDGSGRMRVSGTPFWGEMGKGPAHSGWYPVSRVFLLRKASSTAATAVARGEALARVLRTVCSFGRGSELVQPVLAIACSVVDTGMVSELQFRKETFDPLKVVIGGVQR